jgi:hypothetical protein
MESVNHDSSGYYVTSHYRTFGPESVLSILILNNSVKAMHFIKRRSNSDMQGMY